MAGPVRIAILANASQAKRELNSVAGSAQGLGSKFAKFGKYAAAGAAVAGLAVAKFAVSSVKSASDAQQSLGATETVFGKFADTVVKTSDKAAKAYGLSANEYRENANLLGSLFKNQGVAQDQLSGKTESMIKTAADLAATFGGKTSDAVAALGSAFKGEFDTMEKFGISIKQSDVSARLAAKGQDKLTGAAKKQATQLAVTELITKQAAQANGAFAKEANTLAGQQQRLAAEFENVKAKIGTALLPMLTSLAEYARANLVPALERFGQWLNDNQTEIESAAASVRDGLLPPLKALGTVVMAVAGFFSGLPGPVRSFAVQAALAALVMPRLAAGIAAAKVSAANFATTMGTAATRSVALGNAARGAAGVGGMLALSAGATASNKSVGTLLTTLGGAAMGFQVGGPIGAAVGGLAGLALGLATNTKKAGDAAATSIGSWKDYAATLDQVTGATSEATRAMALERAETSGITKVATSYGFSQRQIVDAMTKGGPVRKQLVADLQAEFDANAATMNSLIDKHGFSSQEVKDYQASHGARQDSIDAALREVGAVGKAAQATREKSAAIVDYTGKLKGLPPLAQTEIKANGIIPSTAGVAKLTRLYNLTPKQIRTVIAASGAETTVKKVKAVNDKLKETGKTKANTAPWLASLGFGVASGKSKAKTGSDGVNKSLKGAGSGKANTAPWLSSLLSSMTKGKGTATQGAAGVSQKLRDGTGKAKANLGPFKSSLSSGISSATGTARSGGSGIGAALGSGLIGGITSMASSIASATAGVVSRAIGAARAAAQARSPSRRTHRLGRDMGEGLARGLAASRARVSAAARALVLYARAEVVKGTTGLAKAIAKTNAFVKAHIGCKDQVKREKALIKRLGVRYATLGRNAKAQDKVNASLATAKARLADLKKASADYAAGIKDTVVASGNITALGKNEDDASVSISGLIDQLKDKVNQAKRFASLMKDLIAKGLNATALTQLTEAGVEGGLATAEALASGGKAAITEINKLQTDLATAGGGLASTMSTQFHAAGIKAAEGLVAGIKKQQAQLDLAARRMANALVTAVRRALGIHSPSQVFQGLGDQVTKGLALGLDEVYVKRQGTQLANSLQSGFGTPALDAFGAQVTASAQNKLTVTLRADQVSALSRGREVAMDLDAFYAAGGRRRS